MSGLVLNGFLPSTLWIIAILHGVSLYFLPPFSKEEKANISENNIYKKPQGKAHILDFYKCFIILVIVAFILFALVSYTATFYILLFLGLPMQIAAILFSVWSVCRYLFIQPFEFKLTESLERALNLLGLFTGLILGHIAREGRANQIGVFLANFEPAAKDFALMGILAFWYFGIIFFSLSLSILALQKYSNFVYFLIKKHRSKAKTHHTHQKEKSIFDYENFLSSLIIKRMASLPDKRWCTKAKKVFYVALCLACVPIDVLIEFLFSIIKSSTQMLSMCVEAIQIVFYSFLSMLSRDKGRAIIIISRISFIVSLLIVLVINRYNQIFSAAGSSVYEFLCSVIIIPLFIAQLLSLKKRREAISQCSNCETARKPE